MKNEIIRIGRSDLRSIDERNSTIENLNRKIQILRKRQLLNTLKESTTVRIDLLTKLRSWIDKLDKRIFSDESINNMSLDKVISLFKYVGNFTLKMMHQMNDLEKIVKEYLETANISEKVSPMNPQSNEEQKALKLELLKSFMTHIKESAAEAIVSQQKQQVEREIELKKDDPELDQVPDITPDDIPENLDLDK